MRFFSYCGRHNKQSTFRYRIGALLLLFLAALVLHESVPLRGEQEKFTEFSEKVSARTPFLEISAADASQAPPAANWLTVKPGLGMLTQLHRAD